MELPSTDPRRFAIALRTRALAGDDLEAEVARELANYEVLERPAQEHQHQQDQAALYLDIFRENRTMWHDVRDALLASGFDLCIRYANKSSFAPVPTTEQLLRLCRDHVMKLLITEPESELYETLVYVLQESTEARLSEGTVCGREHAQALCLQHAVHGLHDAYEYARVGSPAERHSPNL